MNIMARKTDYPTLKCGDEDLCLIPCLFHPLKGFPFRFNQMIIIGMVRVTVQAVAIRINIYEFSIEITSLLTGWLRSMAEKTALFGHSALRCDLSVYVELYKGLFLVALETKFGPGGEVPSEKIRIFFSF
jgi:hypothetical protein